MNRLFIFAIIIFIVCSLTAPLNLVGTVLPSLTTNSPYRVFNDLQKQSYLFVPYQLNTHTWIPSRYWSYTLNMSTDLYPASLATNVYACAQIDFFTGIDENLIGNSYNVTFDGDGVIGIYQNNSVNITVSTGTVGNFNLNIINSSLYVFIYSTNQNNHITNIRIIPSDDSSTFTTNFLKYIKPFQIFRYAYWQGQSKYSSRFPVQIWANRSTPTSATQLSSYGIALEHIIQLQNITNTTSWICIPDTADNDYIANMGLLLNGIRNVSKMLYIEYGNIFDVMNQIYDNITNPKFDLFMQNYGHQNRNNTFFSLNYKDIQYFINAVGAANQITHNFTYIDGVGMESAFGNFYNTNIFGLSDSDLKKYIIDQQLTSQTKIVTAQQLANKLNISLVSFSGGPYLKVYQYGYNFVYYFLKNQTAQNLLNAQQETALSTILQNLNDNDLWVGQLYVDWITRLQNMRVNTIMCSRLVQPFTDGRDDLPLLKYLNSTTIVYDAINAYLTNGIKSTFSLYGVLPTNSFVCSPKCVWGDCINNTCFCYEGFAGNDCSTKSNTPNQQNLLGVNLGGIAYYSSEVPYIDMMKMSSSWVCQFVQGGWNSAAKNLSQIPMDQNGYPTSLPDGLQVGTLIARDLSTHYDNGTYVVLYKGDGTLVFSMYDVKAVRRAVGRIQVDVIPSTNFNNGIFILITRTNPDNPIRDIKVIRPGFQQYANALIFHPMFLNKIKPFSTLRFMDWIATNSQTDQQWTNRTNLTQRTYAINGVPYEDIIKLVNILGKNAWLNIPHLASDDYILQLANLTYRNLRPDVNVYVEYSNEVWGTLFPGGIYAQQQGLIYNLSSDPTEARFCFLGVMTQIISNQWRSIFVNQSASRLKIVVSPQAVNADTTKRILKCQDTYKYADVVAVAPYFSVTLTDQTTLDNLMDTLLPQNIISIGTTMKQHYNYSNQYNLSLMCYQSGQGLLGTTDKQTKLQIQAQSDIRMQRLYTQYLQMLFNNSVSLANLYTDTGLYTKYGSWGIFQFQDQRWNSSYKWIGTSNYITSQGYNLMPLNYGTCNRTCSGNGFCSFGLCICYSDYTGYDCQISKFVDYVQCGYLCSSHGSCQVNFTEGNNRYWACTICDSGWMGAYCSIPICTGKCSYNGICTANQTCSCFNGRTGAKCQIDCGCNGHGTCQATTNTCNCDDGYFFNITSLQCQYHCLNLDSNNCYGPNLLKCNPDCISGSCRNGTCACWQGYTGVSCDQITPVTYPNQYLGINIGGLAYWSTQYLFKDYFLQSSIWNSQYYPNYYNSTIGYTWNTQQKINVLPNGYPAYLNPGQIVGKLLIRDVKLQYPKASNQYLLLYDGEGIINLGFDAKSTKYFPNRIQFYVTPSTVLDNGIYITILYTNPNNPIHNIRVILKQDQYNYKIQFLNDNFIKFISQFSTIRYMDLLCTNGNPNVQWNDTTRLDADTQALPSGISIELLAKIVNRTGTDAWINIPHQASDDYVTKFAQYLYANISSNRTIYVQYSNQVWNAFFLQGQYAINKSKQLNFSNAYQFYANRSLQIFNIFQSVFGNRVNQLQFVISGQSVSSYVGNQILSYPGVAQKAHILAGAPYFDCQNIGNSTNVAYYSMGTVDDIINRCLNTLSTLDPVIQIYQNLSIKYNLKFASYESGTSISEQQTIYTGNQTPGITNLFQAANRDPRMTSIYTGVLGQMKKYGLLTNAPCMIFSSIGLPSKYGSWGILDYSDQINQTPTHPKFAAILSFNSNNSQCINYIYNNSCVTSCPATTIPKISSNNKTLQCVACTQNCQSKVVKFTITVKIKARVLSVVLKPSQEISKPVPFVIILVANKRRLLQQYPPITLEPQTTSSTSSSIAANIVIPSNIDLNIYSGVQIQFQNLTNSPTGNGALISSGQLSFDLSNSYSFESSWGLPAKVISLLGFMLTLLYLRFKQVHKALNLIILLQTLYLFAFNLNPNSLDGLQILNGFQYSIFNFIPSIFVANSDHIQNSNPAVSAFGIDGNLIRNAGFSITILICSFSLCLLMYIISYLLKQKDQKYWIPEFLKNFFDTLVTIVFLNITFFSILQLYFWNQNQYKNIFIVDFVVSILLLSIALVYSLHILFTDKHLFFLKFKSIGIVVILALTSSSKYIFCILLTEFVYFISQYFYNPKQKNRNEKILLLIQSILISASYIFTILFIQNRIILGSTLGACILLLFLLKVIGLVFALIKKKQQLAKIDVIQPQSQKTSTLQMFKEKKINIKKSKKEIRDLGMVQAEEDDNIIMKISTIPQIH